MTVWVIEVGSYSDYHVAGVFSSREKAELVLAALKADDEDRDAEIDEWPLDPAWADLHAGRQQFSVSMRRDGTVDRAEAQLDSRWLEGTFEIWHFRTLAAIVWATDQTHAVKIVNEKRLALVASGEWPEPKEW